MGRLSFSQCILSPLHIFVFCNRDCSFVICFENLLHMFCDLTSTWPPGEMASRLTTNQEIAGSTPAVVISKEALTEVRHFYVTNFKKKDSKGCLFGLFFLVGQHKENRYFESILRGLGTNCK